MLCARRYARHLAAITTVLLRNNGTLPLRTADLPSHHARGGGGGRRYGAAGTVLSTLAVIGFAGRDNTAYCGMGSGEVRHTRHPCSSPACTFAQHSGMCTRHAGITRVYVHLPEMASKHEGIR